MHQPVDDDAPAPGAADAVHAAHARALRACRAAPLSTLAPTSWEVRAELRARFALDYPRARVLAACRARRLPLADLPSPEESP